MTEQTINNPTNGIGWKSYYELCKPKVVMLIIFTAVVGMFLAVPGMVPWQPLVFGTIGIGLAASSAAAINHYLDQKYDAKMARTRGRPLPHGDLNGAQVLGFAFTIGAIAMLVLTFLVNELTAFLTFLSLIGYAVVYTVYLKHATPQNIVIGGAAGAAPPVLGWCAVTATVDPHALLLFLIIFIWTPPHFWALAVARREEYAKADIPMLPVTHGAEFTRLQIVLYTVLLIVVSLLPFLTGMSGYLYLAFAIGLGFWFLYYAILLKKTADDVVAMKAFRVSIYYLMIIFAVLLIDHYI
ncbi:MAG: heme o synthase [Cycloclasticus sp.]